MPSRDTQPDYPRVDAAIEAIAGWINKLRLAAGRSEELDKCSPDDVREISKEMGVPVNELRNIIDAGPGGADLLMKMLAALNVDPQILNRYPAVMRDLQRLCAVCAHKGQCVHELAEGSAAEHFQEFCPNAHTLDALRE